MKKIGLICLMILFITSCSSQRNINQFYNKYESTKNAISFQAPLFLASLILENDPEIQSFRNKVKSIKVLSLTDLKKEQKNQIQTELQQAVRKDKFENWFTMNRENRIINVNAQNRGDALRNLLISMQGENNLIFINAKTNLTETELTKFMSRVIEVSDKRNRKDQKTEITP
ncbi:MAG: DUF4252 domain-containing protein [Flavobacteriaceae bacterium]|nr:DUF4252 domain-containing protein [Flavobacteriaceae bacterium]